MSARVEGWLVGVAAALGVALVGAWLVRTHPFVGMESASYLSNVLDGRPFLVQLFDVQHNDLGNYQARELSYATDLLDAGAVAWWFRWSGHFEALSLSHLVMCAVVVATSVSWLRGRALNLGAAAAVPALLFVTSASTILGERHFRSAKALAAAALAVLAWTLARALFDARPEERAAPSAGTLLVTFAASTVLVLADRQGSFFIILLALLVWHCAPKSPLLLPLVIALGLGTVYDLWLGPMLVRQFGHQEVNWAYQSGSADPAILAQPATWRGGLVWLLDSLSVGFGALGIAWGGAVATGAVALAWLAGGRRWVFRAVSAIAALVVLSVLMKARHAPIDAPDVRVAYYNGPLLALGSVALSLAMARLATRPDWPMWRPRVIGMAVALMLLNLASVPRLAARGSSGADAGYIPVTSALMRCMEDPADRSLALLPRNTPWIGRYLRLCERYRALRPGLPRPLESDGITPRR